MSTTTHDPVDLRRVLYAGADSTADIRDHLERQPEVVAALDTVPGPAREAAATALASAVGEVLDVPLWSALSRGWRTHHALEAAGERTASSPDVRELVELATHEIGWERSPSIVVLLGEAPLLELVLTVSAVVEVEAAVAEVAHGRLVALHAGHCEVTLDVTGSVPGGTPRQIAHRSGRVDLDVAVDLGEGLALVEGI